MAGCRASGRTPARSAGARTARPCAPDVWNVSWPARHAPVSARPATRPDRVSSGTARTTRSAAATTSSAGTSGTPGSRRAARSAEAAERPAAATTSWPGAANGATQTAPAPPAPSTPARRRAGAVAAVAGRAGFGRARRVLRRAGMDAPLVPVPHGYRTSVTTPAVGGRLGRAGRAGPAGGVGPLQPDVSRASIADGECVTGSGRPQSLGDVSCLTLAQGYPDGSPPLGSSVSGAEQRGTGERRGHDGRTDRSGHRCEPGYRVGDRAEPGGPG